MLYRIIISRPGFWSNTELQSFIVYLPVTFRFQFVQLDLLPHKRSSLFLLHRFFFFYLNIKRPLETIVKATQFTNNLRINTGNSRSIRTKIIRAHFARLGVGIGEGTSFVGPITLGGCIEFETNNKSLHSMKNDSEQSFNVLCIRHCYF